VSTRRRRLLTALIVLLLLALAGATGYTFLGAYVRRQVLTLPMPAGRFPVGRATFEFTDPARSDPLAPTANVPRQLAVWVWYPAADTTGHGPATYLPGAWAQGRSGAFWGYFVQDPGLVRDRAVADATPAPGPLRTLVMEPGLGLAAPDYAVVAEDLASRGHVVVGVTPTYSANATVLGGRLVAASDAGKNAGDALARVWAADARFAIDRIAGEARFAGMLDRGRIGFFGHSFGGASAAEACHQDSRCVGAADVDGQPFGDVVHAGLDRPYLLLGSEGLCMSPACADMPGLHGMVGASRSSTLAYAVRGARHFNFTDLSMYHITPPLRYLFPLGDIDPPRALRIEGDLLDAFFSQAFGDPSTITQVAGTYPELRQVTAF
jgi:Platelet-activating factor acetylhydrolase, isoform II